MNDATMPLTAHLEELRWRLIRAFAAIAVAFAVCYGFSDYIFVVLTKPLIGAADRQLTLIGTGVTEAFFTRLKVTFIAAIFAASPIIFYQAWRFVAPGLYANERRTAIPFVLAGTFFFVTGAVFCYVVVFPVGYAFFLEEYKTIGVAPTIRISEYLSFASRMLLAFGVTFELPVVTFFLARIGLVTHRMLLGWFRYAIVVIFIVAAVLTPGPDAASQFLMATPLVILYIISIGVAYFFGRARATPAEPETPSETMPTAE
jgi:sec-independent protein translocase protein TatC